MTMEKIVDTEKPKTQANKQPKNKKDDNSNPKKKEDKIEDEIDLFGEDDEKEDENMKKLAAEKKKQAKPKKVVVAKSAIVFDVKVWEVEQDLDLLAEKIRAINKEGLVWGVEYKKVDIAQGIQKLQMSMVVEDDKVSVDDITETIESWEDEVQSVDVQGFNKL